MNLKKTPTLWMFLTASLPQCFPFLLITLHLFDFKISRLAGDGTGPAVDESNTFTFGAKTGKVIDSYVRNVDNLLPILR